MSSDLRTTAQGWLEAGVPWAILIPLAIQLLQLLLRTFEQSRQKGDLPVTDAKAEAVESLAAALVAELDRRRAS